MRATGLITHRWEPITDLDAGWLRLCRGELHGLLERWAAAVRQPGVAEHARRINERLMMLQAVETGLIERLYRMTPETQASLAKAGIDGIGELQRDGRVSARTAALIRDQRTALEMALDVARGDRKLTVSYIRELHRGLTDHQDTRDAVDARGRQFSTTLLKGEWKRLPNNPLRQDGATHEYCPPEFVQDEIDRLVEMHAAHDAAGVCPEVESAWLHHRFGQIHPFEDGNGRVARCLTAAVFLRGGYPVPAVRDREHRDRYLHALESADGGTLAPLVNLFADIEADELRNATKALETGSGAG